MYPECTWSMPGDDQNIYLTFDDGPHPEVTPFVLTQLEKYQAKATFFCIGKNVLEYPELYRQILDAGHRVGNHTHNHVNGWKAPDDLYIGDIKMAKQYIDSSLFRPPYGRASKFQLKLLTKQLGLNPVMWSVLSGDFDPGINKERCLANVLLHTGKGDIVVLHDSVKAREKLEYVLPAVLAHFSAKGFQFKVISQQSQ